MRKLFLVSLFLVSIVKMGWSQCDPNVPFYVIDLSSNPDTTWVLYEEDALDRQGQCCSADPNENCIQFEITLHPNTAGVFFDYDGAGAYGSLNWQLDCGPEYNLKDTICITGGGTFTLTFCKPGSDNGNYTLISVAQPTFPEDQFVPANCARPVEALGVTESSIVWESITGGTDGMYDTLLSCTNCLTPIFTPHPNAPDTVEFRVCGYPILDYCVGNFDFCDTVKFITLDSILLTITPDDTTFCSGGSVDLTASATGGDGNFTYYWYDNALNPLDTGAVYTATSPGTYYAEVRDGNYDPLYCDNFFESAIVVETSPPVVEAGGDQLLCANDPEAQLNGSISFANGVIWTTDGTGSFDDPLDTAAIYSPSHDDLLAGSVMLFVTSTGAGSSCTNMTDSLQLVFLDTIQTSLSDTTFGCFGSTATITPSVTGGTGNYSYQWTNGVTTLSNDLGTGTHCITVSDDNGCQVTECFTITSPPELNLTVSSIPATTDGGSDGSATANPSGGTGPYTYLWNTTGTNQTENGLSYGIYTVTVTDDNGCTRTASVVVNEPQCAGFSANSASTDVLCYSDSTGTASAIPIGGTPGYTYSWNDYASQTDSTATNLPTGVYEVTITDANGCLAVTTATVFEPTPLLNTMTHTDVTVQGGTDGAAQANATGGMGGYNYLWSTTETTSGINSLMTGWYQLEITDGNGCILEDSVFINEPPCDQFYLYVSTVSPLCNGDLTGEASLTIVNGVEPFSISWSTGETDTLNIYNAAGGIHSVEVTDSVGCYTFLNFGIAEPSPLSIGLLPTASTCKGFDNGTIDMSISGGTYPYYSFAWSNGGTTEDLIHLAPDSYSVTVTDENGCQVSAGTTVTEPDSLYFTYTVVDVTCFDGTDGSIDVTPVGGTVPYSYDWSNDSISQDLNGIDVGGYILNITDGNFCDLAEPVTIYVEQPDKVEADTIIINCPVSGATQTQVDITPIGGTANYAVSTDGGTNYGAYGTYSLTLDIGQSYDIVIKDVNDCISDVYPITIDAGVVIDDVSFNLCYVPGQTDETITVSVSGGTPDYSISTDNGSSFNAQGTYMIDLPINNTYQIVAEDDKGCQSTPYLIIMPDVFDMSLSVTSNHNGEDISCNGASDGEITATVTGGTTAYTYSWSNGASTAVNSNVNAGTYTLTVDDANGCQIIDNITVTEPAALSQSITSPTYASGDNISCNGLNDGSIDYTVNGGTGAYTYSWTTADGSGLVATDEDQSGLTAGTYDVTVTDVNGCSLSNTITLTEPTALTQSLTSPTNPSGDHISCFGFNDGSIDYTVNGGSTAYTYNWTTTDGTGLVPGDEDQSGLTAGTYDVTVTDINGCSLSTSITLTEPTQLTQSITSFTYPGGDNISCAGYNDGSIDYTVNNGSPGYTYSWTTSDGSGLSAGAEDQSNLTAGTYDVTVTDVNGCSLNNSITLTEPSGMSQSITSPTYASGDNITCNGMNDGSIDYTVSGGSGTYVYSWTTTDGSGLVATDEDQSGLTAGTYDVTVTDVNGCTLSNTITLTEPTALTQSITSPTNPSGDHISCFGFNDGSIDYTVNGGSTAYTFSWTTTDGTGLVPGDEDQSGLIAGTYDVTITDLNGCSLSTSITLTEPTQMTQSITSFTYPGGDNISCAGYNDGSIDYTVNNGSPGYTYSWSTSDGSGLSAGTEDQSNLTAGTYDVTVTDINGCSLSNSITLTEPSGMSQSITSTSFASGDNISCNGMSDGSIDYTVTGGSGSYTYSWTTIDGSGLVVGDEDQSGLTAGTYDVTVTDVNGCSLSNSITLTEPTAMTQSITSPTNPSGDNINCFGFNDGGIDYTVNGGSTAYTYSWTTTDGSGLVATDEDQSGLTAGTYNVMVVDINGCSLSTSITLTEPTQMTQSVTSPTFASGDNITCFGLTDGSIDYTVNGGAPGYTFDWDNDGTGDNDDTEDLSTLGAGTYSVTTTDINGCILTTSITLTEPTELTNTISVVSDYNGQDISCYGETDGSAEIVPAGGALPYTYLWNDGQTTQTAVDLGIGTYDVTATDVNGCTTTNTVVISQPDTLDIASLITDVSCNGGNDGAIDITPTGGTTPYSFLWTNGATTEDVSNLSAGSYAVSMTDVNGCNYISAEIVIDPTAIDLSVQVMDATCYNYTDGAVDLSVTGGTPPYTFLWDNAGETTEDIQNLPDGTYTVTVTDDNGCFTDISGIVNEPDSLMLSAIISNATCNSYDDGAIDITLTGGTEPYSYDWSNSSTDEDISGLFAGVYTVDIVDSNGCEQSGTYFITQPDVLVVDLYSPHNFHDHNIDLYGGSDGEIDATVTGGTLPYYYSWSNGSANEDQYGLTAGLYYVEVTDSNGCFATDTIILTEPLVLELPSAFSPNNDGSNDTYVIHGIDAYPDNRFIVTNRWGNVIYETEGYHNDSNVWSGETNQGKMVPDGVYFVILEINGGEIKKDTYVHIKTH